METDFGKVSGLRAKGWSAKVWGYALENAFWLGGGWLSSGYTDDSKPVHNVDELTTMPNRGTICVMPLTQDLPIDSAVVANNQLDGNETEIDADFIEIRLDMLRNAVKRAGQLNEMDTTITFRKQATSRLGRWFPQVVDELGFLTASGIAYTKRPDGSTRTPTSQLPLLRFAADVTAPSTRRLLFGGDATSVATIDASDKMTWNKLVDLHAKARAILLRPVMAGRKETFGVVMHPYAMRDLKQDTVYQTIAAQGDVRGPENQLWTGATKIVEGLALHVSTRVCNTYGVASGGKYGAAGAVDGSQALLFGAQALAFAPVGDMSYVEGKNDDYGDKPSVGVKQMMGWKKPVFLRADEDALVDQDYGIISLYTAAAPSL